MVRKLAFVVQFEVSKPQFQMKKTEEGNQQRNFVCCSQPKFQRVYLLVQNHFYSSRNQQSLKKASFFAKVINVGSINIDSTCQIVFMRCLPRTVLYLLRKKYRMYQQTHLYKNEGVIENQGCTRKRKQRNFMVKWHANHI